MRCLAVRAGARSLHVILALLATCATGRAQEPAVEPEPVPVDEVLPAEEGVPESSAGFVDALRDGDVWVDLRYRFEYGSGGGFPDPSYASTLRTVLGYQTAAWHGLTGLLEFENVSGIGPQDYNDLLNGQTDRTPIPDPPGTSVNRAYLGYVGPKDTDVRLGRQYITLDNQRWVANRPWRQKHTTFDAVGVRTRAIGPVDLYYAYVDQVNGPIRTELDSSSHLLNVAHEFEGAGRLTGYGYLIDTPEVDVFSCLTAGVRFAGEHGLAKDLDLLYQAEVARQVDAGDNPDERDAPYYLLQVGARHHGIQYHLGAEVLGGDGTPGSAVQVPFGKRFFFNGWATVFPITPDTGLRDYYAKVVAPWKALEFELAGHDFNADSGGSHYGSEVDFATRWQIRDDLNVTLAVASYFADEYLDNVTRAWLMTRFTF